MRHLHSAFCTPYSTCCFRRAFPLNQILLSGEPTRLVQAWTASQLRSRNNAGILLFLGQHVAVLLGGGAEPRPPVQLLGCPRIFGFGPAAPALFAASHIPDIEAAPATLDNRVKASSVGRAVGATAAPASLGGALTCWFHTFRFFDCVAGPAPRGEADRAPLRSADPGSLYQKTSHRASLPLSSALFPLCSFRC